MKKTLLKIFCSTFLVAMCIINPVYATNKSQVSIESASSKVARYAGCPEGGRHPMEIIAKAIMYTGTASNPGTRLSGGVFYRCTQCGLSMACQYQPPVYGYLGAYIFDSTHYNGSAIVVSYGVEGYEWDYPTGYMWDGMDWLD